ncbi:MAG: FAD-dependent oxidoreductase, partial [Acetobacteraceae bacterium]
AEAACRLCRLQEITIMRPLVLIIGGGLSGLTAARCLHRAGISFQLLEARSRLGGRILSADASGGVSADGFDLGPSWFWPEYSQRWPSWSRILGLPAFLRTAMAT